MNRFKREINELGFGLYREDKCARICALARTFGISPEEFNTYEMANTFYAPEQDLLHFVLKRAAADRLGITVPQLSKIVRTAHVLTQYFSWEIPYANVDYYPECGPMFVSGDGVEFVLPVFGEDNSLIYSDFPVFKDWMSSECPNDEWHLNLAIIDGIESILDLLEDEDISDEVADAVFIAFSDCVGREYIHPSMLDVCTQILKRSWAA